jgi:hypothetical protein
MVYRAAGVVQMRLGFLVSSTAGLPAHRKRVSLPYTAGPWLAGQVRGCTARAVRDWPIALLAELPTAMILPSGWMTIAWTASLSLMVVARAQPLPTLASRSRPG